MATIKSNTDLKQSKRLAKILPLESADMRYGYIAPYDYSDRMFDGGYDEVPYPKDFLIKNPNFSANEYDAELPCWSLANLLGFANTYCSRLVITIRANKKYNVFAVKDDFVFHSFDDHPDGFDNPVDACYELILKLNELKML